MHPGGERPPALQEHSAVAYKDCLYVFGGELGFSAGTETPLWVYNVKVTCTLTLRNTQAKGYARIWEIDFDNATYEAAPC